MVSGAGGGATAVGIIMLIIGALFTALAVADVFVLIRVSLQQMDPDQIKWSAAISLLFDA